MSANPWLYKESDAARAVRVAKKAGLKVTGLHVVRDSIIVMTEGADAPSAAQILGTRRTIPMPAPPRRALPKFLSWNQNRATGKWRARFRRRGFSCYLPMPDAPDFDAAYAAALAAARPEARALDIGAARTIPGSIDAVIVSYYRLVFPRLKPSTQAMRRNILERFRARHGHKPVAQLERRHIDDLVAAMAKTPHAANNLLKVLRHLLEHGVDINLIDVNPALRVKKFKITGDGIHTWTEDEVAQFEARHPIGTLAYLAQRSLLDTGQRRSDVVRMDGSMCATARSRCARKRPTRRC